MFDKRSIKLKERLTGGEITSGIWVSLPCPAACEVIADAGLDWIVVDAEHTAMSPEMLHSMLMAFKASETVPLIRVPWNDHVQIKQALDMGWDGVLVPQVNTEEEAAQAVSACRYPPVGTRGFGPRRAGNYYRDQDEYVSLANDSVICAIQIENVRGADRIDEIARVSGVDWIFVGPCDMSGTCGDFCDPDSPQVLDAIEKIFAAAKAAGIPAGNPGGSDAIGKSLRWGCQLVVLGEDTGFLKAAVDDAAQSFKRTASDLVRRNIHV